MKRLLFIILILMLAWNAYAIPPTPPVAAGDGSGDVLAGTMGSTGQYCTKNAATKTIDCNTTPSYQAALDIAKGTYTNTYLCKYTSSGTLLDCNVDPAGFQTADADLTAIAGLTSAANAIPYFTGSGTAGVISSNAGVVTFLGTALGAADSLVGVNSAGTALEYKTSLSISSLNLSSATSSIPWVVGTASAPTTEGQAYWNSSTDTLTIGNGSTATVIGGGGLASTDIDASSEIAAIVGDETGSGALVFGTSPTFTTSILAASTADIGSSSAEWGDLYLGTGKKIYFQADQSVYLTPSAGTLTLTGAFAASGSITAGSSATPSIALSDSDNAAGTGSIVANSGGGANDIILSIGVEDSTGESTTYIEVDGVTETVDLIKPTVATGKVTVDATNGLQVGSTGVLITSDNDGAITFLGSSAGNDEDLTINLDDTANTAVVSSSTGVTKIDYGSIGSATTGTISGGTLTPVIDDPDNFASNFTGANLYGGTFIANAAGTAALPNAAVGMNFTIVLETTGDTILEPLATGTDDTIYMNGLAAAQGEYIHSTTRGAMCVFQYRAADTWMATCNGFAENTPP